MIPPPIEALIRDRPGHMPAVALLGPRQVGKTTLAHAIAKTSIWIWNRTWIKERPADAACISRGVGTTWWFSTKCGAGAGVVRHPARADRLEQVDGSPIWSSRRSMCWKSAPICAAGCGCAVGCRRVSWPMTIRAVRSGGRISSAHLERDIPQVGPRISAATLNRFWTMLAHVQGGLFNAAQLARGLAVDGKTVARYLDLLVDLMLVRRLAPFQANIGNVWSNRRRLCTRQRDRARALEHRRPRGAARPSVSGASWEGFVIESRLRRLPGRRFRCSTARARARKWTCYWKSQNTASGPWKIKRGASARPEKGFFIACDDLKPARRFVVNSGTGRYRVDAHTEAIGLRELAETLAALQATLSTT